MMEYGRKSWRKKCAVVLILMTIVDVELTVATFSSNSDNAKGLPYHEKVAKSADGQVQILYANKTSNVSLPRRQSDQIMILGNSRITIPKDKENSSGVKMVTGDSYVKALEYSQNIRNSHDGGVEINSKSTQLIRREFNPSPIYKPSQEAEKRRLHPRILQGAVGYPPDTREEFSPPVQPPANFNANPSSPPTSFAPMTNDNVYESYGIPPQIYDPYDTYGPPIYHDNYKPMQNPANNYYGGYPQQVYAPQQNYGNPHSFDMLSSMGLSWPVIKLNAVTLAKILLKVVIFKMIVKFIGLVCLLLFIPKLEFKKEPMNETESEDRSLYSQDFNYKYLDEVTTTVWSAIEQFEKKISKQQTERDESCSSIWCIVKNAFSSTKPSGKTD